MVADAKWGPLAPLAGVWEGDNGLDVSFVHRHGQVRETRFRERAQFAAFGPVENGRQVLYGLDYRTAAWREGEQDPFHTEVGYWLWDAADGQVMRCFVVPRGSMVLAGGTAAASDRAFTMDAEVGSETYGVLSNRYLSGAARTVAYHLEVTVGDDWWSYEETATLEHAEHSRELLGHSDRNRLERVE